MKINFVKLHQSAITPNKSKNGDAGYDLFCINPFSLKPMERKVIPIGISVEIPNGYYGRIAPRSGKAFKYGLDVLAGVIDCNYRGEIGVVLINLNESTKGDVFSQLFGITPLTCSFIAGESIAQLIIEPCLDVEWNEVKKLSDTERNSAGFGSTDKR